MLDINIIKDDPQRVKDTIKNKQLEGTVDIDELLKVDIARRQAIQLVEEKRAEINNLSSKISTLKDEERLKLK